MTDPVPDPRGDHEQAPEEHRVSGHHRTTKSRRGSHVGEHPGQRRDDDGDAEHVHELHPAQHEGHPRRCRRRGR